ncbi:hypothetical protein [Desulfitibacter alkalitolerans]|uniref:hypothetical protein n=1 Tax=Desulfitibacter alkalitolerans TaxID=264641 RepID=UPI00048637A4|nr:hypothetical protein [Desulfitibacter alkalitolerans]
MSEKDNLDKLSKLKGPAHVYMQAEIIDQLNTNNQSNMTLSAYSIITQSSSMVKISSTDEAGGEISSHVQNESKQLDKD